MAEQGQVAINSIRKNIDIKNCRDVVLILLDLKFSKTNTSVTRKVLTVKEAGKRAKL